MKNISTLFIEFEKMKNENGRLIDLTKKMDSWLAVYSDRSYRDPELKISAWSTLEERDFLVSEISMGTQTGTHIDAPSHFFKDGVTLESLKPEGMMGRYMFIDLNSSISDGDISGRYCGESILFLSAYTGEVVITEEYFNKLLSLKARLWVLAGECRIAGMEEFYFHKKLLSSGKFLVEDLDLKSAENIKKNGFIIALPLNLTGVSGSPCRILAIQEEI